MEQIKERLGIRAKGRKIYERDDEYQLREGQTVYGDWPDSEYENIRLEISKLNSNSPLVS